MPLGELQTRLIRLLSEEERLSAEDNARLQILSEAALQAKGKALLRLSVAQSAKQSIVLQCSENNANFREGDLVVLKSENHATKARIRQIEDNGRRIIVACKTSRFKGQTLTMVESGADFSTVFRMALAKLAAGEPGWWLLDVLEGSSRGKRILSRNTTPPPHDLAEKLCAHANLQADPHFTKALACCLARPKLFAVQGPPGTGKTVLLALAAEGLAQQGMRVAVTAHTHQAVNNALSTLHELFPNRRVCKLGNGTRRESLAADIPSAILKDEFGNGDGAALDATIFGLTFASATVELSLKQSPLSPHVVLVDEAGQLPLPYAAGMGLMGAGSYLMFGDDRQMPPVFRTSPDMNPDAVSVFTRFRHHYPQQVIQLAVTHRMNHELCTAVSQVFYEAAGLPGIVPSASARIQTLPLANVPGSAWQAHVLSNQAGLCWIDSPVGNDREANPWEAQLAVEIAQTAIAAGLDPASIGIIVPFRRQVALIRRLLSRQLHPKTDPPIVDTVERLQGVTVQLIILSATASDVDYVSETAGFLFSANRLNVAVSRARSKAIIIGSQNLWQAIPKTLAGLEGQRTWAHLREQAAKIPPFETPDPSSPKKQFTLSLAIPSQIC